MKSFFIASLFICLFAFAGAVDYNASTTAAISSISDVTINVTCSGPSNFSYFAAWLGNNQKDVNVSVIKSNTNENITVNASSSFIYGRSTVNGTEYNFTLNSKNLSNIGENYTYVAYCESVNGTNTTTSSGVYNKWLQPDNNGSNYRLSVVYNGTLSVENATKIAKAQAQAVWDSIIDLDPNQVVDESGNPAVRPSLEVRLLAENTTNTTTVITYILKEVEYYNDSTCDHVVKAFENVTLLGENIQASMNKSGLGNFTVLNVTYVKLPAAAANLTSSNQTNSTINVTISSQTLSGEYYIVGTYDQTYNPVYLSKENVVAGTNEKGETAFFNFTKSGNLSSNGSAELNFTVPANTTVRFFAVIKENIPKARPSNIAYGVFSSLPNTNGSSNTSNATNFTATVNTSVSNTSVVTINVFCSQPSTEAIYGAVLGNHEAYFSEKQIVFNLDNKDFFSNEGNEVFGKASSQAGVNEFTFTVNPTFLRNTGHNYSLVAFCQNTSGNYSEKGFAKWNSPDNGGKDFLLVVTYNGSINASGNALNQARALASLLPNVSATLIVTSDGTQAANTTNKTLLARMLADSNTTIQTYVLRNYSLAVDNTSQYIEELNKNSSVTTQNLQSFYKNQSINITALNFVASTLAFPSLTLAFISSTDSQAVVQLGANVAGSYSLCAVNSSYDPSKLDASDVMSCVDENVNVFPGKKQGSAVDNEVKNVTFSGLKANSSYIFLGVLQNTLPVPSYSQIKVVQGSTKASTFGEKLVTFVLPLIALIVAVLLN
jgi:hypothetical protein